MAKYGERFSDEDIKEFSAYHAAGLTPPAKFDDMVQDNTDPRGPVYRHATEQEQREAKEAADAAEKAAEESKRLDEKVRAEATKRAADLGVAPPPPPPAPPAKPS
jgi:hypothetical protein